jgi:hypothetical protein
LNRRFVGEITLGWARGAGWPADISNGVESRRPQAVRIARAGHPGTSGRPVFLSPAGKAYGVNRYDGSWKFDKGNAMVDFTVAKMNGEVADVKNLLTGALLGVMDRDDGTMRFYRIDRKGYEEFKKRGDKGPEAMSVRLRKEG